MYGCAPIFRVVIAVPELYERLLIVKVDGVVYVLNVVFTRVIVEAVDETISQYPFNDINLQFWIIIFAPLLYAVLVGSLGNNAELLDNLIVITVNVKDAAKLAIG